MKADADGTFCRIFGLEVRPEMARWEPIVPIDGLRGWPQITQQYQQHQADLFDSVDDVDLLRWLLADLHDGLSGKLARFRQLTDLSAALGPGGTLLPGGETTYNAWSEARTSFIHGNYIATVMLCQGLADPLSHYRNIDDPANLSRRAVQSKCPAEYHLLRDASFAISMAVRLLSLPPFRLSGRTILDENL